MTRPLLAVPVAMVLLAGCGNRRDDSDPAGGRSEMRPLRDALTGCEYLVIRGGQGHSGITPRMRADGTQVCRPELVEREPAEKGGR